MHPEYGPIIAVTTARILAGILFFFQGYDKIFHVGINRIKETMQMSIQFWKLPSTFVGFVAYFTSWAELIGGLLLILGLFKYYALALLCMNILIVAVGFSMSKPMWETGHVFIRIVLLLFLLVTPTYWDILSIDRLITILTSPDI